MPQTPSKVEKLTQELVEKMRSLFVTYGTKATKAMGETYAAGLLPRIRQNGDGSFRPDAQVVILKVNESTDDNQGTASDTSGEGEVTGGSEKPAEAPATTG